MIGKLKKRSVRDKYGKRVMRLSIDIPVQEVPEKEMDGEDVNDWLENRVGELIGFDVTSLEDQDQKVIMDVYDKV
jgi:hypothetical protein